MRNKRGTRNGIKPKWWGQANGWDDGLPGVEVNNDGLLGVDKVLEGLVGGGVDLAGQHARRALERAD